MSKYQGTHMSKSSNFRYEKQNYPKVLSLFQVVLQQHARPKITNRFDNMNQLLH